MNSKPQPSPQRPRVKLLLTVPEAAQALGVGRSVIYDLLLCGSITSVKIGRARRIPVATLEAFIASQLRDQEIPWEGGNADGQARA